MKKTILIIIIILSLHIYLMPESREELLSKLDNQFSSIETFSASFTEKIVPIIGEPQTFEGTIEIARPTNLRMDIVTPQKQLILYNGTTAWLYIPEEKYCIKYKSEEENFLSSIPGYIFDPFNNLNVDTLYSDTSFIFTTMSTKEDEKFFDYIKIKFSKDKLLPLSFTLKDKAGNITEYKFFEIKINTAKKVNFTFSPPDNIEIIEK